MKHTAEVKVWFSFNFKHYLFIDFQINFIFITDYFLSEYDVIKTTFSYLSLINANNIQIFNETEQFICTLMAFMCKELAYFNEDIGALLSTFVKTTFTNCPPFYFENKFDDKYNFENLYIEALDQFQGVSYGNTTFGALILAPLAQRHDIKWRHMVWSEHIAVLRFIKCNEKQVSPCVMNQAVFF